MWLTIASILAAFTFSKARDEEGNEIEIDDEFYDSGLITSVLNAYCSNMLYTKRGLIFLATRSRSSAG